MQQIGKNLTLLSSHKKYMMQRTILMVTNNYTPYSGGVVSSVQVTADALRHHGNRVIIVTLDFLGTGSIEEDVIRIASPVRFKYRNNHMAVPWKPKAALRTIIATYKPDIVHVHHPFLLGESARCIAQQHTIPVVFTYHTLYEEYLHYVPLPRLITKPILSSLVRTFCNQVDAIIAPSFSVQERIRNHDLPVAHIIPSAIAPEFVVQSYSQKKIDITIELITVSRFTPEKNIFVLLELMTLLREEYRLTLIGYGAQQAALESYAYETLKLSKARVQFIVKPAKNSIAAWYKQAHLFVFASVTETQGLVLAEAMAAGTPVVALRGPGIVDIVEDGANGFMVDSVQQMAECIMHIATDQKIYATLQQGAFETAKKYHPQTAINQLFAIYEKVLNVDR